MGVSRLYASAAPVRTGAERATLVRRTYSLVFASILVTMLGVAFAQTQPALLGFAWQHPFIMFIATFVPLMAAQALRDRFPVNIALTFAFTFAEGVFLAPFLMLMERNAPGVTSQAALLTGSTFAVLTGYAFVSRRDFSAWGSFLITGLWVLIGASLLTFIFPSAAAGLWIAGVGTLLFSGLLVFDTWRLRNVYGPDDYVIAAVQIYLDLLNMFLFILRLLGGGRRN
ncbi:BAX inhibitor protein [Gemmatimonadetes bacterium T265]|nr:BAX inhibitor protein [Gemmatimonadetes bacterium T265]